jgi:hypothetical protein
MPLLHAELDATQNCTKSEPNFNLNGAAKRIESGDASDSRVNAT